MVAGRTLRDEAEISGLGLVSGRPARLRLVPGVRGRGIRFREAGSRNWSSARAALSRVRARTVELDATIRGVEHLLATCSGLGICCLGVLVEGEEVPGLDGSAGPFLDAMDRVGLEACCVREVRQPLASSSIRDPSGASIRFDPAGGRGLSIAYRVDFRHFGGDEEVLSLELDEPAFRSQLARARTFALPSRDAAPLAGVEGEPLWASTKPEKRRFANELVRHKMLDLLGDLALVGAPLHGRIVADRAGHRLHLALAQQLAEQQPP